jgi:peroxiredoxin
MGQKMSVKAGDTIPSVVLCDGMQFPPKLVNVADEIKGKKVLIMGLPGAFTPC